MLSLHRVLTMRHVRRRWDRVGLVVASIALGVATLVSTSLVNQAIDAAAQASTNPLAGAADLVVSNGDVGVRLDLTPRLREIAGVASVRPLLVEMVQLTDFGNRPAVLIGLEPSASTLTDDALGVKVILASPVNLALALMSGRAVFVGDGLGVDLDKPLTVRATTVTEQLRPAGRVSVSGPASQLGRNVLVMDVARAATLLGRPGLASRLDVRLAPGADRDIVKHDLETALAGAAAVYRPEEHGQAAREVIGGVRVGFMVCGVGALVVGLFLVYNALSVSVAERRHEIGVMRSLGATRGQVAGLIAGEAALLGLVGSMLGVFGGWGLALAALGPTRTVLSQLFVAVEAANVTLTPATVLLAIVAGTATALLAALVPTWQAAIDQPADVVRRSPATGAGLMRLLQAVGSLSLISAGIVLVMLRHTLPLRLGSYGGMVLALVGLLWLTPLAATLAARSLQPLARMLLGIEARLAADNLLRAPGRTGVVIGALAAGVSLILQIAGVGKSNEVPVLEWIDSAISADLFVSCGDPTGGGTGSTVSLEPEVGDELAAVAGVWQTMLVRSRKHEFRGTTVLMYGLDGVGYHRVNAERNTSRQGAAFDRLTEPGTALVSDNFAALHRIAIGDRVTLAGPSGPVELRVIGTVLDYSWNRGTLFVDREATYVPLFADRLVDVINVYASPEADVAAVKRRIEDAGAERSLVVMDRHQLRGYVTSLIQRLYALAYVQQMVVGVVASLGVVTALLISVLQRRRELGLLRAVGATRGQVLRTVLAEAALLGVIGTVFGTLIGLPIEWYIVRVVILEESGFLFPVLVPWVAVAVVAGLAVGLATLAGLGPALHAARLDITEAVAYE